MPAVGTLDLVLSVVYATLLLGFVAWTVRSLARGREAGEPAGEADRALGRQHQE
jgi:TRAP-type C4-dicarboxylate transport system permease small subunit